MPNTNDQSSNNNNDNAQLKSNNGQSRSNKIPEWKKQAPKEGEPTTIVVDGCTYHWCTKCLNGQGMWAMHKTHDPDFKEKAKTTSDTTKSNGEPTKTVRLDNELVIINEW